MLEIDEAAERERSRRTQQQAIIRDFEEMGVNKDLPVPGNLLSKCHVPPGDQVKNDKEEEEEEEEEEETNKPGKLAQKRQNHFAPLYFNFIFNLQR